MYQVWAKTRACGLTRRNWCPTFSLAGQTSAAHQPGCVLAANVNALAAQYAPHLPDPVDTAVLSMNVTNVLHENSVAKTAGA